MADPGIALLLGAMLCLALERKNDARADSCGLAKIRRDIAGPMRSGCLWLCGSAKRPSSRRSISLGHFLPALLLPFLLSAALQLAQGSRVVTAAVAAQILAGYPLPAVTLALLIASGAFMFSYVTDPYFWLIKSSTGASMKQTVLGYTLPLSLLGLAAFALAAISSIL